MLNPLTPRRGTARLAAGTVATALGCTLLLPAAATAAPAPDAYDVLDSTTAAQRQALASTLALTAPDEVLVADGVDLSSADRLDVIVMLRQPVASTAIAMAAANGDSLSKADAKAAAKAAQDRFVTFAKGKGLGKRITSTYDEALNAVALSATGDEISVLLDSHDVAGVWPNETITLDLPTEEEAGGLTGGGVTYDEVAALHAEGITGDGIKVGVLDTGIDYLHPALADVYAGGWDAVDGDDDPMETTYADWKASGKVEKVQGSPYYTSHGTHVAGIIAGQDDEFGGRAAWGVAPEAEIYGYRVLGPYGSGSTEDILEGMEHALQDGMDVINMSLGGSYNDHQSVLSVAADNLTLAGVTTVIAAGNDGDGAQTLGSPGTSALAITVGANDSPLTLAATDATVDGVSGDVRLLAQTRDDADLAALELASYPIIDVGDGTWRGYSGKNPTGAVVLIERGATTFNDMVTYAKRRGAVAAIVVNNRPDGHIAYYLGEDATFVPTFSMSAADGAALRAQLAAGAAEVSFGELGSETTEGDTLASFSSRGPVNGTTDIKPEITAPGVSVMSSVPTWHIEPGVELDYAESYARMSGTSMATPFVAGLAALMLEDDPTAAPADVKTRLMNTADGLRDDSGVFESGAGQVDPRQAVHGTADAQVIADLWREDAQGNAHTTDDVSGALVFGMLPQSEPTKTKATIELTNRGSSSVTYTLAVDTENGAGTVDIAGSGVSISTPSKVTVPAGATRPVQVTLEVPAGAEEGTYGGFVTVGQKGEEDLRLPFGFDIDTPEIVGFQMLKPVMSTSTEDVWDPALKLAFGVATPTRVVDLFLVDSATGEDVGYLGALDATLMRDGLLYGPFAWYGGYLPLTGDKDFPISHKEVTVEPGLHSLRVIGTDDAGHRFESTADFYVDNTAPEFTTNLEDDGIYEFANGQSSFALNGSLVDGEVEAIRAAGIDVDQSDNTVQFFSTMTLPTGSTHADETGAFAADVPLYWSPVQSHRFLGMDAAGNIGGLVQSMWFKETQAYVVGRASATEAREGDTVTMSFTTNGADRFGSMTLTAYYNPRDTTPLAAVAQEAFAEYGRIDGEMTTRQTSANAWLLSVPVVFDGEKEYTGDDLPLIDIEFAVPDTAAAETTGFLSVSTYVKNLDGRGVSMQRAYDQVQLMATRGIAAGGFYAQGLLTEAGAPDAELDHSAVGASATLTSVDGQTVAMEIGSDGSLTARVPLTAEDWNAEISLPGHLTAHLALPLSTETADGGLAGTTVSFGASLAAGDVNGDDVVDILDAIAIRDAASTSDRAADINYDGVVDSADLAFVELNWLVRNPTADTVPTPKDKHRGVTLDEVLATFAG
ncbi:S8 family serine peptidase [Demequina zhanjiangensis]|uniref:S8 family serine peptidase n=1 Tax=Demequina zhanjiangensis TaxID=3051659 RepID=A0ABT8G1N3_9MICO|nr:S8 family serine peptidase [Demequina sp. SYSU T00b26]MDN4472912.1 S8 family serine peptidase [Demequina sp. SYSU T00b26]